MDECTSREALHGNDRLATSRGDCRLDPQKHPFRYTPVSVEENCTSFFYDTAASLYDMPGTTPPQVSRQPGLVGGLVGRLVVFLEGAWIDARQVRCCLVAVFSHFFTASCVVFDTHLTFVGPKTGQKNNQTFKPHWAVDEAVVFFQSCCSGIRGSGKGILRYRTRMTSCLSENIRSHRKRHHERSVGHMAGRGGKRTYIRRRIVRT